MKIELLLLKVDMTGFATQYSVLGKRLIVIADEMITLNEIHPLLTMSTHTPQNVYKVSASIHRLSQKGVKATKSK